MNALSESAGLFEVNFPDYKQLRACRKEVFLLKQLWDMIEVVLSSIEEWKDTLWSDINVENMEMECKRFVKEIRGLDKEMRAWDAFSGLDSTVKNMVTSLRAVGELQNPAIRDRHWQQLMQATKVSAAHFLAKSIRSIVSNQFIRTTWMPLTEKGNRCRKCTYKLLLLLLLLVIVIGPSGVQFRE